MKKHLLRNILFAGFLTLTVTSCNNNKNKPEELEEIVEIGDEFETKTTTQAAEIYDFLGQMYQTKTFHHRIYGTDDTFNFIYHNNEYISQSGGDLNFSAIKIPSYKATENFDRVYYARYTKGEKGHRNYYLGEAIYKYNSETYEIAGPETSIDQYNPVYYYNTYRITGKELTAVKNKEGTYVIRYNESWYNDPDYDNIFYYLADLMQGGEMAGHGRLKKIEVSMSTDNSLKLVGFINNLETGAIKEFYESRFYNVGTAKDIDLEKFLASDEVKISSEAPTNANFANIFADHVSTDTTIYEVVNGNKTLVGQNHLDYDANHAHIYGLEGNNHYTNQGGQLYRDFVDGGNTIYHRPELLPYSTINGLKNNVDVNDFRKVGENKYRYYGVNFAEVFGDLSETSVPGGWAFANLSVELKNGLVDKYVLQTSIEEATLNATGETVLAYYIFETQVVNPRTVDILTPFPRNEEDCARLENALDVLNNGEVEFKVHGEEHSDDPDTDSNSIREVTYALDYVYEEHWYTKPHCDANGNYTVEDMFDRDGYYLSKDNNGNVLGVQEFKYNYKGDLMASRPLDESKKSLDSYWYYAEPAGEIFSYDANTRTYTSKPYTGYFAAILIGKAFEYAANDFMDEVRITLNETLDKVERIEYDMVWLFSDGWMTKATGRLDFTYGIDTEPLRTELKAMESYHTPTKWSESDKCYEMDREFSDYVGNAKNCHGEQFTIDMLPYLYDEKGDSGWAPVQFTIIGAISELWVVNDNGCKNPNYMKELVELYKADPDFTLITNRHLSSDPEEVTFKNGDLIIAVFPRTNDGFWIHSDVKVS